MDSARNTAARPQSPAVRPISSRWLTDPTPMDGGSFQTPRAGTAQDVRFTRSKDDRILYATLLGWPGGTAHIGLSLRRIGRHEGCSVPASCPQAPQWSPPP